MYTFFRNRISLGVPLHVRNLHGIFTVKQSASWTAVRGIRFTRIMMHRIPGLKSEKEDTSLRYPLFLCLKHQVLPKCYENRRFIRCHPSSSTFPLPAARLIIMPVVISGRSAVIQKIGNRIAGMSSRHGSASDGPKNHQPICPPDASIPSLTSRMTR